MDQNLKTKLASIRLLALDFDGVLTDGHVYVDEAGRESVRASRRDGMGIAMLQRAGVEVAVISREENPVVAARCKKLQVLCMQGIATGEGKAQILLRLMQERGITREAVAYMGDDVNDLGALSAAGVPLAVRDADPAVQRAACYITERNGGKHAVREVCNIILEAKDIKPSY